jgi:UDP:flavonoid glycosyltransferase YjiC (YdhE family)
MSTSQGLQEAGHEVILATNPTLCSLAASHGVLSAPVGPAVDMGEVGARLMAQSFNNMWIGMIRVMQLGARLVEEAYPDVLKLCQDADLVIASDTGSGIAEAESGVPWISVTLQPGRIPVRRQTQLLSTAPSGRSWRSSSSCPPTASASVGGAAGGYLSLMSDLMSDRMILLPVSRYVAPPDPRWPRHIYPTGYWFARGQKDWDPPQDLVDFLKAGEKPIAVSLGVMSMSGKQARQGAQIVLQSIRETGVRAVLQGWEEAKAWTPSRDGVCPPARCPQLALRPGQRVIHHGLRHNGRRAALRGAGDHRAARHRPVLLGPAGLRLGVAPGSFRGRAGKQKTERGYHPGPERPRIKQQAGRAGTLHRAEPDGVTTAVRLIEEIVGRGHNP